MLEIIALILITKYIGNLALQKGLKPLTWKLYTVICWIIFEIIGMAFGMFILKQKDLIPLMLLGLVSAFGGFLLIRAILQKQPDNNNEDIDRIGTDDLKP
jgi:hypothetical protein